MPTQLRRSTKSTGRTRQDAPRTHRRASLPPLGPVIEPALLYAPPEAAAFLRLSPRSLERWRVNGRGPKFVRMGRRVVYEGSALLAFIAKMKRAPRPAQPRR
jgi:hypothetical protein